MLDLLLALLIEALGADQFRVRQTASAALLRLADLRQTREALIQAQGRQDPEIRRRAAAVIEQWASVWPLAGYYPLLRFLEQAAGQKWPQQRLELERYRRWVARPSRFWWEPDPIPVEARRHLVDTASRLASAHAARLLLAGGKERDEVRRLLDLAVEMERGAGCQPIGPPPW